MTVIFEPKIVKKHHIAALKFSIRQCTITVDGETLISFSFISENLAIFLSRRDTELLLRHERARTVSPAARNEDEIQMYIFPPSLYLCSSNKVFVKEYFLIISIMSTQMRAQNTTPHVYSAKNVGMQEL